VHESPNADQTAAEFWSGQVAAIDLWGNAYAEKIPGSGNRIAALSRCGPT
jgi:phage portal protein BeeE